MNFAVLWAKVDFYRITIMPPANGTMWYASCQIEGREASVCRSWTEAESPLLAATHLVEMLERTK